MCGIAGFASWEDRDLSVIREMAGVLRHRGPDAEGVYRHDRHPIFLAHRRLSVLDLSEEANQPFLSASRRHVIVFNGEIYNFPRLKAELQNQHGVAFRTTSDTEVVVEAFEHWGPAMVSKLEGMFAFVILDIETGTLYIYRDRLGKKPLFYFEKNEVFAFASELKALRIHPALRSSLEVDTESIAPFLHLGYIPEPLTIYKDVRKFPAGYYGVRKVGEKLHLHAYWSLNDHVTAQTEVNYQPRTLEQLVEDAVRKRLISDVPLGAFLSGGTDSSLVVAIASRLTRTPLRTFSIGFDDARHDETQFAGEVASHFKTEHTQFRLNEKEALEWVNVYLDQFDEPFADTSAIPTMLVSKLAREQVTVALTGDGGDELFQGYGAYRWADRLGSPGFRFVRPLLRSVLLHSGRSRWMRIAAMLDVPAGGIRSHVFSQEQYLYSQKELREKVLLDQSRWKPFLYEDKPDWSNLRAAEKQALFDLQYYLRDDLLVKVDRASMFSGLECRCPLLDHQLVEYALKLPFKAKVSGNVYKFTLKKILSRYLPANLVHRPKKGFSVPLSRWLRGEMKDMFDEFLDPTLTARLGVIDPLAVQDMRTRFLSGQDFLYNRLWAVIVLQRWLKNN